jgi:hypothetical protein
MNIMTSIFSLSRASRLTACLLGLLTLVLVAAPASATVITAGDNIYASGENKPPGGSVVAGGAPISFSSATFTGQLTTTVYSGDPSNSHGGLTFTYLLTDLVTSPGIIDRITINGYTGSLTDVSYQAPGPGVIPTISDRLSADVVGFTFIGPPVSAFGVLHPGQTSALLVIQTDATQFTPTLASIIDGSTSWVSTFAPLVNAPEPSTLVLAGFAALAFGSVAARRRRARR